MVKRQPSVKKTPDNTLPKEPPIRANGDAVEDFDIWEVLRLSVTEAPPPSAPASLNQTQTKPSVRAKPTLKSRIFYLLRDLFSFTVWGYIILKLFFFDIDVFIVSIFAPSASWVLDYRFLSFLLLISLIALFFWRLKMLLFLLYVLFFPFIVIPIKILMLFIRFRFYKSWIFWMILFNSLVVFVKNFRYYLWSTSLGLLALLIILISKSIYFLIPATICIAILLLVSLWKLAKGIFQPDWFLKTLTKAITFTSSAYKDPISEAKRLLQPLKKEGDEVELKILKGQDLQTVASQIQMGIIATRILYFAAYKLQQYRQLQLSLIFNLVSFSKIVFASLITFTAMNIALLKIDPSQFKFEKYPSIISMTLYSLSSFALNDGGGISPVGDLSYLFRIIAGLYGLFFIGIVVVNFIIAARSSREDAQLKSTVEELRVRAKTQEADFNRILKVSFEEAFQKLVALGLGGMATVFNYIVKSTPVEFISRDID